MWERDIFVCCDNKVVGLIIRTVGMIGKQKILVIGGGVIGNSVSYFLARDYKQCVTIVDPVGIAPAASGKAGGFLALEWRDDDPDMVGLHRRGFDLHEQLSNELDGPTSYGYRRLSCVGVDTHLSNDNDNDNDNNNDNGLSSSPPTSTAAHSTDKPEHSKENAISTNNNNNDDDGASLLEWIDVKGVVKEVYEMGDESNIAQVHPKLFCERLFDYCQSKVDTKLHLGRVIRVLLTNTTSQEGDSRCAAVCGVELEDGTILDADVVVVACGPWSQEAFDSWFDDDDSANTAAVVPSFPNMYGLKCASMLVSASPKVLSQAVFLEGAEDEFEVYPRPDGNVYINGYTEEPVLVQERPGQESTLPQSISFFQSVLNRISTSLRHRTIHTIQSCYMPSTHDGDPIISPIPNIQGAFVAAGHGPWGIQQGPSTGEAIAQLIMEGTPKHINIQPYHLSSHTSSP